MRRSLWSRDLPLLVLVALALAGCGDSGGGGGGGSQSVAEQIAEILGYKSAEGLISAPLSIGNVQSTGVVLRDGEVATGGSAGLGQSTDSYYLVSGITAGVEYLVTLSNLSDDADMHVFQTDSTFATGGQNSIATGAATETVRTVAGTDVTNFFVGVDGFKTELGATYRLSVQVKPVPEGTVAFPVELGTVPFSRPGGKVGKDTHLGIFTSAGTKDSFYSLVVSEDVLISLSDLTDDVDLYVFSDSAYSALLCSSTRIGTAIETCQIKFSDLPVPTSGPTLAYIAADGAYTVDGASFKINAIDLPTGCGDHIGSEFLTCDLGTAPGLWTNENAGTTDRCAFILGSNSGCDAPAPGDTVMTVLAGGQAGISTAPVVEFGHPFETYPYDSFYSITIPAALIGKRVRLALEDATDAAALWVFDKDNSFATPVCKPPYENPRVQECVFTASAGTVYLGVDGSATAAGAAFQLSLFPEFVAEGTYTASAGSVAITPKSLGTAPIVPSLGTVHTVLKGDAIGTAEAKDSFYKATVVAGKTYLVAIPFMSDNVDLYVYGSDSTFLAPKNCPNTKLGGTTVETCLVTMGSGQTTLYLAVDGFFTKSGAAFTIQVVDSSTVGEGAQDAPLSLGEQPLSYAGHLIAKNDLTFPAALDTTDSYYRVTVTPGLIYNVSLTGVTGDADIDLYVYSDKFDNELCHSYFVDTGEEDACTATGAVQVPPGVRELFIFVDGGFAAAGPNAVPLGSQVNFTLKVERPAPPAITPMTAGQTLTNQSIDWAPDSGIGGGSDKYYSVPVTAGSTYRVQITSLSDDLDLYLFGTDADFSDAQDCPNTYFSGTSTESCDYVAPAAGTLYFAVDGYWMEGNSSTYSITVTKL